MPTTPRSFAAQNFLLSLDGVKCGFIKSMDGGGISADVVQEPAGNNFFVRKHLARVRYEDLFLQIDLSHDKAIYDWIAASWTGSYSRKDIDILMADSAMQVGRQMEFFNALITEVTIPKMDAGSKEPCYLTLRLTPEYSRSKKSSGKLTGKPGKSTSQRWLSSNFRLEIDGLDCTRVSKVDAFSAKQTFVAEEVGQFRAPQMGLPRLEFSNLKITLAENFAQSWINWHEDFVIKGNCGESQEKRGSLSFLTPNLDELARINFFNLGIFRLAPERNQLQPGQVKKIAAELYCERMEFVFPKS